MKKSVKILLILGILFIIMLVAIFIKLNKKSETENIPEHIHEEETKIVERKEKTIVKNRSDFYTVSSCVNMYLSYENSRNKDILINILDESFKNEKNITKSNVLEKIDNVSVKRVFSAEKMYYEINNNIRNFLYLWKCYRRHNG